MILNKTTIIELQWLLRELTAAFVITIRTTFAFEYAVQTFEPNVHVCVFFVRACVYGFGYFKMTTSCVREICFQLNSFLELRCMSGFDVPAVTRHV
jgi:hypothetical protein